MIDPLLLQTIKQYQKIPNVPFQQKHTSEYITQCLRQANIAFKNTPYFIMVEPKKLDSMKKKLLLMAHTDHPGVVFNNNHEGKLLGLKNTHHIPKLISNGKLKIKVYDTSGKYLGVTKITSLLPGSRKKIFVEKTFDIPKNSFGLFDVADFTINKNTLHLYNADDGLMVSILLYLLCNHKLGQAFNTYTIFFKHEEVHQVSSWHFAKNNPIQLNKSDYILNLECAKTDSIDSDRFGIIDYQLGPVLQLSNTGCLFGYQNPGPNLLELELRNIAARTNQTLQIGLVKDSCDSRSFTQFAISPNICTLTIPNRNKHNGLDDGQLRTEEVFQKHISATIKILERLTNTSPTEKQTYESVSQKLKSQNEVTDTKLLERKQRLNNRLEVAYRDVIKRGYFYPQNLHDFLTDLTLKSISYFNYYLTYPSKSS